MSEAITEYVEAYLLHDPVGNTEGVVAEYEPGKLEAAEEMGAVFLAVYNTGRREIVKAGQVVEPTPRCNGVELVRPAYVDERMEAVLSALEALAAERSRSGAADAAPFAEALAALEALVRGEGGE